MHVPLISEYMSRSAGISNFVIKTAINPYGVYVDSINYYNDAEKYKQVLIQNPKEFPLAGKEGEKATPRLTAATEKTNSTEKPDAADISEETNVHANEIVEKMKSAGIVNKDGVRYWYNKAKDETMEYMINIGSSTYFTIYDPAKGITAVKLKMIMFSNTNVSQLNSMYATALTLQDSVADGVELNQLNLPTKTIGDYLEDFYQYWKNAPENSSIKLASAEQASPGKKDATNSKADEKIQVNLYGTTNKKSVKLYQEPTEESKPLINIREVGTHVFIITHDKAEDWANVNYNGHSGYIKMEYLDILSKEESEKWAETQDNSATESNKTEAQPTESPTPTPTEQDLSKLKTGDIVKIGLYEQDNDKTNQEPIEWKVLAVEQDKVLLLSVYGLDGISYGKPGESSEYSRMGMSWESSYIRSWLNQDFYQGAFSEAEKKKICSAKIVTRSPAGGSYTTTDKVFLLSADEAKTYLKTPENMACKITPYSKNTLRVSQGAETKEGYGLWLLRDLVKLAQTGRDGFMSNTGNEVAYIPGIKGLEMYNEGKGYPVQTYHLCAVRPAMWIAIKGNAPSESQATPVINQSAKGSSSNKLKATATPKPKPKATATPKPKPKATATPKPTKKPSFSSSQYLSDRELIELAKGYFVLRGGTYESISDASIEHKGDISYVYFAVNFHCYVVKINRRTGVGLGLSKLF